MSAGLVSPRECLDMLYLAHYFRNQEQGRVEGYKALIMFHMLRHMELISESQRRILHKDPALMALFLKEATSYRVARTVVRQRLLDLRAESQQKIILVVDPGDQLRYPRVFGGNGYLMVLTEAGEEYAADITRQYRDTLNASLVEQAWVAARQELRNKLTHMRNQREELQ